MQPKKRVSFLCEPFSVLAREEKQQNRQEKKKDHTLLMHLVKTCRGPVNTHRRIKLVWGKNQIQNWRRIQAAEKDAGTKKLVALKSSHRKYSLELL
jgi:hypothetical protein